jgi:hypothetical protein
MEHTRLLRYNQTYELWAKEEGEVQAQ